MNCALLGQKACFYSSLLVLASYLEWSLAHNRYEARKSIRAVLLATLARHVQELCVYAEMTRKKNWHQTTAVSKQNECH